MKKNKKKKRMEWLHMFYVHFERLILSERYALCAELPPFVKERETNTELYTNLH